MDTTNQTQLFNSPLDGITQVCFCPDNSGHLLASSWDKTLRLYETTNYEQVQKFNTEKALLDCCFGQTSIAFSGSLDNTVKKHDLHTGTTTVIGQHERGVQCVEWSKQTNCLYSGSWDKTVQVWDPRTSIHQHTVNTPHKVLSMDLVNNALAIAMGERRVYIYDIRNMSQPSHVPDISLNYLLKSIRLMPDAQGFACSSVEGRAVLEYFDPSQQDKNNVFKLHRHNFDGHEVVYPVNALAFHPTYGTFASGGSDHIVSIWDGVHRKRLKQFTGYPDTIACLNFSHDGSMLAIASSDTFDQGPREHSPNTIFIRHMEENEVRPRSVN